jgi:hypothetical protein
MFFISMRPQEARKEDGQGEREPSGGSSAYIEERLQLQTRPIIRCTQVETGKLWGRWGMIRGIQVPMLSENLINRGVAVRCAL